MLQTSQPGEMDELVEILVETSTPDGAGGFVRQRQPFAGDGRALYAKAYRKRGDISLRADIPTPRAMARLELRFVPAVNKAMLIRWQGETWKISDLNPHPREDRLFIDIYRRGESGDGGGR